MPPFVEKNSFIPDPKEEMSIAEKNSHLSNKLAIAPYRTMKIVRIERKEIKYTGWLIIYR